MPRRDPFDALERVIERVNEPASGPRDSTGEDVGVARVREDSMPTDIADDGDAFVVAMDVPGYRRDDLSVRVVDDVLHVDAERSDPAVDVTTDRYIRKERRHREESRSIMLPEPVDPEAVTARLNQGVLTVRVPKASARADGRAIEFDEE